MEKISKKKRILLAEDDPFIADIYITYLKKTDFDVIHVKDGEECLSKLNEENFDLILLDILLPKIDGFEILKKIKNNPKFKNIPIIALTNLIEKTIPDKAIALGAKECLVKSSYQPKDVVEKIKLILGINTKE